MLTSINHFAIFVHICKFNCVVLDLCPLSFDYLHPYILRTVQIGKWRWPLRTVTWKIEMFINLFSVFFWLSNNSSIAYPMSCILAVRVNWVFSWKFVGFHILTWHIQASRDGFGYWMEILSRYYWATETILNNEIRQTLLANSKWLNCNYDRQGHCSNLQSLIPYAQFICTMILLFDI